MAGARVRYPHCLLIHVDEEPDPAATSYLVLPLFESVLSGKLPFQPVVPARLRKRPRPHPDLRPRPRGGARHLPTELLPSFGGGSVEEPHLPFIGPRGRSHPITALCGTHSAVGLGTGPKSPSRGDRRMASSSGSAQTSAVLRHWAIRVSTGVETPSSELASITSMSS